MGDISTDYLRSQRDSSEVLKVQLARIRGASPNIPVVVLEGNDDLIVFEAWFTRVAHNLEWAPLAAKGKRGSLDFRAMLRRDLTGLSNATYFIVDSDYDGLRQQEPGSDIYVLPAHSVENYLASSRVVKSVLQTDLHVVGDRALLRRLINDYEIVVNVVMEYLLPACKLLVASVGERVGNIVVNEHWIKAFEVGVSECRLIDTQGLDGLVRVDQHPSDDALKRADLFFEDRQLQLWIRGKFLLVVFKAWIDAVFEDLRSAAQDVSRINQARQTKFANYSPATLDIRSLAAKSDIPEGFAEFAALIAA